MTGGDNVSNIKEMYAREHRYIEGFKFIRKDLTDILQQPVSFVPAQIRGLIDFIGDLLNE